MGNRVISNLKLLTAGLALVSATSASAAMDINIDGFGSAFYGETFDKGLLPSGFTQGSAPDLTHFSLIGFNVGSKINDQWSIAAQLVGKGSTTGAIGNNYNISAEYAFVQYKPAADWTVRAGRQRLPFFTASEYINEHYQLPMRDLPFVVYTIAPFATFDGVSVGKAFDVGMGKVNVALFGGNPLVDRTSTTLAITGQNLFGGRVNWEGEGWRVRVQASTMEEYAVSSSSSGTYLGTYMARQTFLSAGYRFDKYNVVSWGEFVNRQGSGGTINTSNGDAAFHHADGGYVLVGYRMGDWMPRYTFARGETQLAVTTAGSASTNTVGVNYTVNPKVILKAEWEHVEVSKAGVVSTTAGAVPMNHADSAYVGVDFAF